MAREMKDSGVEWIGQVPNTWKVIKAKRVFIQRSEKGNNVCEQLLSPTQKYGVIPQSLYEQLTSNKAVKLKADTDFSKLKTIHKNDYCISLRSFQGGFEYSLYEGVVSPAYQVFYASQDINHIYYKYLFKSIPFIKKMNSYTLSLRDGKNISFENFANSLIPLPPLTEQQKIADFLDEKVKEIDNAIEKTKETIELYKKYKQAIITEAVTKGLDPNVEMKDSGVEWIGKIPVGWQVKRAKNVVTEFAKGAGITKEDVDINGDISCVRYGEIYTKYDIDFVQAFSRTNLFQINTPKYIEKGDILFSGTGELVEEIGKNIVYLGNEPCIAGGDIIIAKHKCNASFLNYAFNSSYSQMQKSSGKSKLKVVHISASDIGNILLAIPPACEQEAIANYLNQKIDLIDFINKSLNELVPMFENYKKSLIYEYVTGKKEVK